MPVVVFADAESCAGALGIEVRGELKAIGSGIRADDESNLAIRTQAFEVCAVMSFTLWLASSLASLGLMSSLGLPVALNRSRRMGSSGAPAGVPFLIVYH